MKNVILFLGSLLFYAWGEPEYCILMLLCGTADYLLALLMDHARGGIRTAALVFSAVMNVGAVCFFRYADSAIALINRLFSTAYPALRHPFPVGIMVYSLLSLSYVIGVYRREYKASRNPIFYLSYIALFPLAFVGPLVKYGEVEEQLAHPRPTLSGVSTGMKHFCVGLAKKVLLADNLILLWETVSAEDIGSLSMLSAWMGIVSFGLAVYFSLSGYCDMAGGLGDMMGLSFGTDFKQPFAAASVSDFCRRWHISLQEWFKDNMRLLFKTEKTGFFASLFATLFAGGLIGCWYGQGLHFFLWGIWMALFVLMEKRFLGKFLEEKIPLFGEIYMLAVVTVGWVIFALPDFRSMGEYLTAMIRVNRLMDGQFLYWFREYALLLILSILMASPLCAAADSRLKTSTTGYGMALYRLCEKVIPAFLLLFAIAGLVGSGEIPVLFWN